ncbi:hypothetical protein MRX96_025122 [Rhipicephalus microplus]
MHPSVNLPAKPIVFPTDWWEPMHPMAKTVATGAGQVRVVWSHRTTAGRCSWRPVLICVRCAVSTSRVFWHNVSHTYTCDYLRVSALDNGALKYDHKVPYRVCA